MRILTWLQRSLRPGDRDPTDSSNPTEGDVPEPDADWTRPNAEDIGFRGVSSRLTDDPEVRLQGSDAPEPFRHLLPYARHWCIGDDVERGDLMWLTPPEELDAFVAAVWPLQKEIDEWIRRQEGVVPCPDAVLAFDQMMQAAAEAVALFTEAPEERP